MTIKKPEKKEEADTIKLYMWLKGYQSWKIGSFHWFL